MGPVQPVHVAFQTPPHSAVGPADRGLLRMEDAALRSRSLPARPRRAQGFHGRGDKGQVKTL